MTLLLAAVMKGHPYSSAANQPAATRRLGSALTLPNRVELSGEAPSPQRDRPWTRSPEKEGTKVKKKGTAHASLCSVGAEVERTTGEVIINKIINK